MASIVLHLRWAFIRIHFSQFKKLHRDTNFVEPFARLAKDSHHYSRVRARKQFKAEFVFVGLVHARNMHEGIVQVGTKNVRKSTMNSAVANADLARRIAGLLIEKERRETGSLMTAYSNVARAVGTTAGWMRKFVKEYEVKEPGWTVGWNIIDHYKKTYNGVCNRVEQKHQKDLSAMTEIQGEIDAINQSILELVSGKTADQSTSARARSGAASSRMADQA